MAQQGLLPTAVAWTEELHIWIEAIEIVGGQVALVQRRRAEELRRRQPE